MSVHGGPIPGRQSHGPYGRITVDPRYDELDERPVKRDQGLAIVTPQVGSNPAELVLDVELPGRFRQGAFAPFLPSRL